MTDFLYMMLGAGIVLLLSFLIRKLPGGCTRDCNQGRNCDCGGK